MLFVVVSCGVTPRSEGLTAAETSGDWVCDPVYRLPHFQLEFEVVRVSEEGGGLLRSPSIERLPSSEPTGDPARWK